MAKPVAGLAAARLGRPPLRGDEFEQQDQRWAYGGDAGYRWHNHLGKVRLDKRIDVQPHDDSENVGLYSTVARQRPTAASAASSWRTKRSTRGIPMTITSTISMPRGCQGEPAEGVEDRHNHLMEPRTWRLTASWYF